MRLSHTLDMASFRAFWYWINERHMIYIKSKVYMHPKPWTEDQILQDYRFCNVFRELDTVTKEFKAMFAPYALHDNLWFLYCLARQINWPETVQELVPLAVDAINGPLSLPEYWNPEQVYRLMRARQAAGKKLYTGAYMLRGDIQREGQDNNKPRYTVYSVLDPVWKANDNSLDGINDPDLPKWMSIQDCTAWLSEFSGWGGFLAYEVATDLRHTRYLKNAPDIMTWANAGPGAKRGLNRIFGRNLNKALSQEQALDEMRWLLGESKDWLKDYMPSLEMRDIEHSLCEADKYLRVKHGEGRPRAKYNGAK